MVLFLFGEGKLFIYLFFIFFKKRRSKAERGHDRNRGSEKSKRKNSFYLKESIPGMYGLSLFNMF